MGLCVAISAVVLSLGFRYWCRILRVNYVSRVTISGVDGCISGPVVGIFVFVVWGQKMSRLNYVGTDKVRDSSRDKMTEISQTTLPNVFTWEKTLEFLFEFHWSLFLIISEKSNSWQVSNDQVMDWHQTGDKPYLKIRLPTSLWQSEAQMRW